MDVLIFTGAFSAFIYSLIGTFLYADSHLVHHYLFYESGTTIISLVLLGNLIEKKSVKRTTTEMNALQQLKIQNAKKVEIHDNHEHIKEVKFDDIRNGDLFLVNEGDKIPIDGYIQRGECMVNESLLTGESLPVFKRLQDNVIGGTIVVQGNCYVVATIDSNKSFISAIIETVKKAQADKPQVQKLADKISAIFVPVVIVISLLSYIINNFILHFSVEDSIMRSIAVLVISCPCAMGLATPTAVMVGIGKAAKHGILITKASALEIFAKTKSIIFDKTGTITTGNFTFQFVFIHKLTEIEVKNIIYNLEKYSSHPIAKSVLLNKSWFTHELKFTKIEEIKGKGMVAQSADGNSWRFESSVNSESNQSNVDLNLIMNNELIAGLSIIDEIKEMVKETISYFNQKGINTVLLSGDKVNKCDLVAKETGFQKVYAEQSPINKLSILDSIGTEGLVTMVGDGINDAPALNKASIGVSFGTATDIAQQSAQLILIRPDFSSVIKAHIISQQTYNTIKQNLFWAFAYNIVAIPLAAAGFMHPMLAAASMAFSDVIVIGNAIRLRYTKIKF